MASTITLQDVAFAKVWAPIIACNGLFACYSHIEWYELGSRERLCCIIAQLIFQSLIELFEGPVLARRIIKHPHAYPAF